MKLRQALGIILFFPYALNASFIESSIGTAIVEDATATYFNPSVLTAIKKKQVIALSTLSYLSTDFAGQVTHLVDNSVETGSDKTHTQYVLPSFFYSAPLKPNLSFGIGYIINNFTKEVGEISILRFSQTDNTVHGTDLVTALSYQITKKCAIGSAFNYSRASFLFEPLADQAMNLPDRQSRNQSKGEAFGWDIGLFLIPRKGTIIGINHRSAFTFHMQGVSQFDPFISNNYQFTYFIPSRSVASISQNLNPKFKIVGSAHYIQWSIFDELVINNLATQRGILPLVINPLHYKNTWIFTGGTNYKPNKKLTLRLASSYVQSQSEGAFQIDNGDSVLVGFSVAYAFTKHFKLDAGYSHVFVQGQTIQLTNSQDEVVGENKGAIDALALKLTLTG